MASSGVLSSRFSRGCLVIALLAVHAGLLAWGAYRHSPTFDETAHLPAGLSHWELGRFELYRVNPHLVRMVAALPVKLAGAKTDWSHYDGAPGNRSEFQVGEAFFIANGYRTFWLFTLARWACIPFSLLGAFICYRWAFELFGPRAGFVALALWCFEPNILGNAQTIQPDAPGAAMAVTALYCFWRWCRRPGLEAAMSAAIFLGLAQLTKTTLVLLFPMFPLLWLLQRRAAWRTMTWRMFGRESSTLAAILVGGLYVLNAAYFFDGTFDRLGDYQFFSNTLTGRTTRPRLAYNRGGVAGNRFKSTPLAALPVPLPRTYVHGMDSQKLDFERQMKSYMRGVYRTKGWWYYYLYALAVKVPLGIWLLGGLAAVWSLRQPKTAAERGDEAFLLIPALILLAFVSAQTGMNNHSRYVLPIFPMCMVWMSQAGQALSSGTARFGTLVAGALAWAIASSLLVYPHSHGYFNELGGGPRGGHFHLISSNIDYGEDLLYLKHWLDQHPEASPLQMAAFSCFDPRVAGIEFSVPPRGPIPKNVRSKPPEELGPHPGWYAVSVNYLRGPSVPLFDGQGSKTYIDDIDYGYFLEFEPVAMAGYSTYIYHISLDEANRVRQKLQLPPLPASRGGI